MDLLPMKNILKWNCQYLNSYAPCCFLDRKLSKIAWHDLSQMFGLLINDINPP